MTNNPSGKLRKLTAGDDEPIEGFVRRAAHELSGLREKAKTRFCLTGGESSNSVTNFTVQLSRAGVSWPARNARKPALLAITAAEILGET